MAQPTLFIKKLSSILQERLDLPMWGKVPEFPWESFSEVLKKAFSIQDLSITPLTADWKEAPILKEGLGEDLFTLTFSMTPLSPCFFWMMSKEDLQNISILFTDLEEKRSFSDEIFQKAFAKFIFLDALKSFDSISPYEGLKARLYEKSIPQETAYCIDVSISFANKTCLGRLVCPLSFHRVLTSHFSSKPTPLHRLDSSLELCLSVQAGKTSLTSHELLTTTVGDFIILDECHYHPDTHHGTLTLTLDNTPLFIVKRKNHELKVLDYALYSFENSEVEDDFMIEDIEDEENISEESEDSEEEIFEDLEEEEEEESSQATSNTEELISSQEIPLSICIEVAKIKMPLKEILSLQPGSTLQLSRSLEQGVCLTLNSKVIAKGELLQIGDLLGVKISEISH